MKKQAKKQNYLDELQTDKEKQLQDVQLPEQTEFAIELDDSSGTDEQQPLQQSIAKQLRTLQRMKDKNQLSLDNAFQVDLPDNIHLAQQSDFKRSSQFLSSLAWLYGVRVDCILRDTFKVKVGILRIHGVDEAIHHEEHFEKKQQQQQISQKLTTKKNLYQYGENTMEKNIQSIFVKSYDSIQLNPFFHQTSSKLDQQQLSSMLLQKPMFTEQLKMIIDPDQLNVQNDDSHRDVYGIKIEFNFQEPLQLFYSNLISEHQIQQDDPIFCEAIKIKDDLLKEGKKRAMNVNFSSAPSLKKNETESLQDTDWNQYFQQIEFYQQHFSSDDFQSLNLHTSDIKLQYPNEIERVSPQLNEQPQEENQNWEIVEQQQPISDIGNYDLIQFYNEEALQKQEMLQQQEQDQQFQEIVDVPQFQEQEPLEYDNQNDLLNEQEIDNYFNEQLQPAEMEHPLKKQQYQFEEEDRHCLDFSKIKLLRVMKTTDNEKIKDLMEVIEERNLQKQQQNQQQKFHFEKQKAKSNLKRGDKKNVSQSVKWDFMDVEHYDRSILSIKKSLTKPSKNTISIKFTELQGQEYKKENFFEYFMRSFGGDVVDDEEQEPEQEQDQQWLFEDEYQIQDIRQDNIDPTKQPDIFKNQNIEEEENIIQQQQYIDKQQQYLDGEQQYIAGQEEQEQQQDIIGDQQSRPELSIQKSISIQRELSIEKSIPIQQLAPIIEEPLPLSSIQIERTPSVQKSIPIEQPLIFQPPILLQPPPSISQPQQPSILLQQPPILQPPPSQAPSISQPPSIQQQKDIEPKIENFDIQSERNSRRMYPSYATTFKVIQSESQRSSQIPIKVLKQCVLKIIGPMLVRGEAVSFLRTYNTIPQIFPSNYQTITINQLFISFLFVANDEGYILKRQERFLERESEFIIKQKV